MVRTLLIPFALMLLILGCTNRDEHEASQYRAGAVTPGEPLARMGDNGAPEPILFGAIAGVATLADGRIAIADQMEGAVHIFSETGTHLVRIGRIGEGPGEFRFLLAVHADSDGGLFAWDPGLSRLTHFDADGELKTVHSFESGIGAARLLSWDPQSGEVLLGRSTILPPSGRDYGMSSFHFYVASPADESVRRVLSLPYQEVRRLQNHPPGRGGMVYPVPLSPRSVAVGSRGILFYSTASEPVVRGYDTSGSLLFETTVDVGPREVTPEQIEQWRESVRHQFGDQPGAEQFLQTVETEAGISERAAIFAGALGDSKGNAWFRLSGEHRWIGIGADGSIVGDLLIETQSPILEIGEDYLLLLERDELDRTTVVKTAIAGLAPTPN